MYWRPIIIVVCVTGGILILLAIFLLFACIKSRNRQEERMQRKNSLRASMRASKASMISAKSLSHLPPDMQQQHRRRPPLSHVSRPLTDDSFFDLSGVTLGESSDWADEKSRMNIHRPNTPDLLDHDTSGFRSASNYRDRNVGAVHRGSFDNLTDIAPASRAAGQNLENEIRSVPAQPQVDRSYNNRAYDDQRSLDRSVLDFRQPDRSVRSGPQKPRPPLAQSAFARPPQSAFAKSRPPMSEASSLYDPNASVNTSQTLSQYSAAQPKPRPPLQQARGDSPHSDRTASESSYATSVAESYNTSQASGGARSKPRPPLNTGRARPPLAHPLAQYPAAGRDGHGYPLQRQSSRETLGSSSTNTSFEQKPRPTFI